MPWHRNEVKMISFGGETCQSLGIRRLFSTDARSHNIWQHVGSDENIWQLCSHGRRWLGCSFMLKPRWQEKQDGLWGNVAFFFSSLAGCSCSTHLCTSTCGKSSLYIDPACWVAGTETQVFITNQQIAALEVITWCSTLISDQILLPGKDKKHLQPYIPHIQGWICVCPCTQNHCSYFCCSIAPELLMCCNL